MLIRKCTSLQERIEIIFHTSWKKNVKHFLLKTSFLQLWPLKRHTSTYNWAFETMFFRCHENLEIMFSILFMLSQITSQMLNVTVFLKFVYCSHFWTKCLQNLPNVPLQFSHRSSKTFSELISNWSCNFSKIHVEKSEIFLKFQKNFSVTSTKLLQNVSRIFLKFLENYFSVFCRTS